MSKRVLIILGHPSTDSFCGAIANNYFEAATHAGREVRIVQLGALNFDPVLHEGYNCGQPYIWFARRLWVLLIITMSQF